MRLAPGRRIARLNLTLGDVRSSPAPFRRSPLRCPTQGVVLPAWGGNGKALRQRHNLKLGGDMGGVGDKLAEPEAATGNNHGTAATGGRSTTTTTRR